MSDSTKSDSPKYERVNLCELAHRVSQHPPHVQVFSKLVFCVMPVAQIAVGAVHLYDCPRQPFIPMCLIVVGVFSLSLAVLPCLPFIQLLKNDASTLMGRICTTWNSLISIVIFLWFITGNVWIYSIYQPNYNKNTTFVDPYCDEQLYLFSFWTTTLVYILLGSALLLSLGLFLCFRVAIPDDDDD
ncbi:transmembrane protein 272-like [Cololabis saira]|uniref:transmembrane protein 272-like n=1 Tax=Cololabis saira TaxID=129043 RepID=UPI002AD50E84|nr:transmembrane protein 272-like [Cololabis saira]